MPRAFIQRTIWPRGYELDRDARIPARTILRYMEHLRWESLGQQTVDLASLFSGGQHLVVVAQQLHLIQDIGMSVELRGTLDLGHVGTTSLEFVHAFDAPRLGTVARGAVTAVFLDPTGVPTPLPEAIRQVAGADQGRQQLAPALAEPVPSGAWSARFHVRPGDLDLLRHVNHANYLGYFEDARIMAASCGALEAAAGAGGRFCRGALDYRQQAVLGDELEVYCWPLQGGEALGFELRRTGDGKCLSRARIEPRTNRKQKTENG